MKLLYDRQAERREFSPGDQVLMLSPVVGSPFQAKYAGPYTVKQKISAQNYVIATPKRRKSSRLCHVNLLKPYYSRVSPVLPESSCKGTISPSLTVDSVSPGLVVPDGKVDGGADVREPDDPVICGRLKNSETLQNLESLFVHLPKSQGSELEKLIRSYPALCVSRSTWQSVSLPGQP